MVEGPFIGGGSFNQHAVAAHEAFVELRLGKCDGEQPVQRVRLVSDKSVEGGCGVENRSNHDSNVASLPLPNQAPGAGRHGVPFSCWGAARAMTRTGCKHRTARPALSMTAGRLDARRELLVQSVRGFSNFQVCDDWQVVRRISVDDGGGLSFDLAAGENEIDPNGIAVGRGEGVVLVLS